MKYIRTELEINQNHMLSYLEEGIQEMVKSCK